ncbi:MAG TPA: hypothetical protein VHL80_21090 [Polyangia bacterium]|nr:hypothetical protein [Polyangia bacterium]
MIGPVADIMSAAVDSISGPAGPEAGSRARPWSSAWVGHYDRASRRRHHRGGNRRVRAAAKRRRLVERVLLASMTAGVVALVTIFYAILSR